MRHRAPLLLLLLAMLTACTSADTVEVELALPGQETQTRTLTVEVDQELRLTIDSNISTGYGWELVEEPDEGVLQKLSEEYEGEDPESEGGGGVEIWIFKAVAPGTTEMLMEYRFQDDPAKTSGGYRFTVRVSEPA